MRRPTNGTMYHQVALSKEKKNTQNHYEALNLKIEKGRSEWDTAFFLLYGFVLQTRGFIKSSFFFVGEKDKRYKQEKKRGVEKRFFCFVLFRSTKWRNGTGKG